MIFLRSISMGIRECFAVILLKVDVPVYVAVAHLNFTPLRLPF